MMPPVLSPSAMPPPGMAPAMGQPQYSQMPPVVAQLAGYLNGSIVTVAEGFVVALTVWSSIHYAFTAFRTS